MQTFKELKDYIAERIETQSGLTFNANNSNSTKAIYLVEKPETHKLTSGNAVIIKFNEINGGQTVHHYSIELKCMAKEMIDVVIIKDAILKILDFTNAPCPIANYTKFVFSNEGGIYYDENNQMYVDKLYYDCKMI